MTTVGNVGRGHVLALVAGVLANHDGIVVVRHGLFLQVGLSAMNIDVLSSVCPKDRSGVGKAEGGRMQGMKVACKPGA